MYTVTAADMRPIILLALKLESVLAFDTILKEKLRKKFSKAMGNVSRLLPFGMFVLDSSCIKADYGNDKGSYEGLDGTLLHETDQGADNEKG